jgi:protein-disulfide isomerase
MAGWRAIAPKVGDLFAGEMVFSPIAGLDGFRQIEAGAISAASVDPFFGLDENRISAAPLVGSVWDNLHFAGGEGVPVAEFTDYNCPYCKILGERVHGLADEGLISLSLHHLPLLGEGSVAASRLVLGAQSQGDTDALHRRIMAARFRVDENYARATLRDQGFDTDQIDPAMATPHISRAKALSQAFGIIGTPALVVGRTLVVGAISEARLRELIEVERSST